MRPSRNEKLLLHPLTLHANGRGDDVCTDFMCFVLFPRSLNDLAQIEHLNAPPSRELPLAVSAARDVALAPAPPPPPGAHDGALDTAAVDTSDAASSSDGEHGGRESGAGADAGVDAAAAKCSRSPQSESRPRGSSGAPELSKNEMDMAGGADTGAGRKRLVGAPPPAAGGGGESGRLRAEGAYGDMVGARGSAGR